MRSDVLPNEYKVVEISVVTDEQIEELKRVAPAMLEEWSQTKRACKWLKPFAMN